MTAAPGGAAGDRVPARATGTRSAARADRVAARATGVGIGLLAFMIAWLVGARVTEQIWGPPSSAVVALLISVAVGILVAAVAARRLVRALT